MNVTTKKFQTGDRVEFELLDPGVLVKGTIVGLGVQEESTLGPLYTIKLDEPTETGETFTMLYGDQLTWASIAQIEELGCTRNITRHFNVEYEGEEYMVRLITDSTKEMLECDIYINGVWEELGEDHDLDASIFRALADGGYINKY